MDPDAVADLDERREGAAGGSGEHVHLDLPLREAAGQLEDVDVHPTRVTDARLVERRGVQADHRDTAKGRVGSRVRAVDRRDGHGYLRSPQPPPCPVHSAPIMRERTHRTGEPPQRRLSSRTGVRTSEPNPHPPAAPRRPHVPHRRRHGSQQRDRRRQRPCAGCRRVPRRLRGPAQGPDRGARRGDRRPRRGLRRHRRGLGRRARRCRRQRGRAAEQRRWRLRPGDRGGGRRRGLGPDVRPERARRPPGDPGAAARFAGRRGRADREPRLDGRADRLRGRWWLHRRQARAEGAHPDDAARASSPSRCGSPRLRRGWSRPRSSR